MLDGRKTVVLAYRIGGIGMFPVPRLRLVILIRRLKFFLGVIQVAAGKCDRF